MPTTIRSAVSKNNPFYISKHRYYELKHFCLQYPEWKQEYARILSEMPPKQDICNTERDTAWSNRTANLAVKLASIKHDMDLVSQTVDEAGDGISTYLFKCVTEGIGYSKLYAAGVPCGKEYFYDRYRAFFWLLDKKKG